MTGYLQKAITMSRPYSSAASAIAELLRTRQTAEVVDLGSGAGGPWPELRDAIEALGVEGVSVLLTDLHPNSEAVERLGATGSVRYHPEPVSALAVPTGWKGIRTMFTALHHFSPTEVRSILESARRDNVGFAAFEATHRSVKGLLATLAIPLLVLVLIPRIRPVRWQTLIFTYLIPIIPVAIWWDGVASTLRTYRASEVEHLARGLGDETYEVRVSERAVEGLSLPVLQVIGRPVS